MSVFRKLYDSGPPLVNIDNKGKPDKKGRGLAKEAAVKKFLDAGKQVEQQNKRDKSNLTAQDLLQEEAIREYVKDLEFSSSPEKFLNDEDVATYKHWRREVRRALDRLPFDVEGPDYRVIAGFVDGKKVILSISGICSYYNHEKLDEAEASKMYANLSELMKQRDKNLKSSASKSVTL